MIVSGLDDERDMILLDVQTGMLDSGSESNDIRNFLGSDESEDILDIYNRLTSIEICMICYSVVLRLCELW